MKQNLFLVIAALLLLSCRSKPKGETADGVSGPTALDIENLKKMSAATDEMTAKADALKKLEPLDTAQLKLLLPAELAGMKRRAVFANNSLGYAVAESEYGKGENTSLKLTIQDCAGEDGANLYTLAYWGVLDDDRETGNEYTRTIDVNGTKAVESFRKDANLASLIFPAADRLLVVFKGRNLSPSTLQDAAQKLKLKLADSD